MAMRSPNDQVYREFAMIGKAVAHPHRLQLLDLLMQQEHSVEQLAQESGLSVANTSSHLQTLRRARLVEADKRGIYVIYRVADPQVRIFWRAFREIGSARLGAVLQSVDSYVAKTTAVEMVDKQELLQRLRDGSVIVLDVRPAREYQQGHIRGARSIPLDLIEAQFEGLPRDLEVVAYCRGPYCVLADEAVYLLRQHGFRARRLSEGFPEWLASDYPHAVGDSVG